MRRDGAGEGGGMGQVKGEGWGRGEEDEEYTTCLNLHTPVTLY